MQQNINKIGPGTLICVRAQPALCRENESIIFDDWFSGEKGFEPLTFGFGDHYSTIGTILLDNKITRSRRFAITGLASLAARGARKAQTELQINYLWSDNLVREIVSPICIIF